MSVNHTVKALYAPTVCHRCKQHKKACSKTLPCCSRCNRLSLKCSYLSSADVARRIHGLVPVSTVLLPPTRSWTSYRDPGIDGQDSNLALRLLDDISRNGEHIGDFCKIYFTTFHSSLPIINEDDFGCQLQRKDLTPQFATLLLSMTIIAHLSSKAPARLANLEELFVTVKRLHTLLQSTGKISIELIQAGLLIASYEYCQALGQDAWLSIGVCSRMGYVLGLHKTVKSHIPTEDISGASFETRKCVWWGIVVLERVIAAEYRQGKLPFASHGPALDDILPVTPDGSSALYRVSDDLITPDMVHDGQCGLFNRKFTRMGHFGSTIQAAYLSDLVDSHIAGGNEDHPSKEAQARKLDAALQSFFSTLLPPPGKADGQYCGSFGVSTSAAFALHMQRVSSEESEGICGHIPRAILALQSLSRIIIHATKTFATTGKPWEIDRLAFWSHRLCALAALVHVKYGFRDEEWGSDLQALKSQLQYFEPRYKIYGNYLQEIEEAERTYIRPEYTPAVMLCKANEDIG